MTREIKYRAFYEKMYQVDSWNMKDGIVSCSDSEGNVIVKKIKNLEIVQFTGLFDKNGKEIYEGDLLKNGGDNPPAEVNYKDGCFYAGKYGCELWKYSDDTKEIIGNIYEQPELINK